MKIIYYEKWGYLVNESFPALWCSDRERAKKFTEEEARDLVDNFVGWAKSIRKEMEILEG